MAGSSGMIFDLVKSSCAISPREITRLGISRSFQVSQVFQSMKVSENLLMAVSIHRNTGPGLLRDIRQPMLIQAVDELVERFGLSRERERPAHELSQGARKLLDIAMACAGSPRVLMLDEPTSGISTEEKFEFMARVTGALARSNVTMLIVEHDMDIIQRFVSRVLAFAQGRIICDASVQEALRNADVVQHVLGIDHALA